MIRIEINNPFWDFENQLWNGKKFQTCLFYNLLETWRMLFEGHKYLPLTYHGMRKNINLILQIIFIFS